MNRIETIKNLTGLTNLKKVINIKQAHTNTRASVIVEDSKGTVYEVMYNPMNRVYSMDMEVSEHTITYDDNCEDVKDAFRVNHLNAGIDTVVVFETYNYNDIFKASNMSVNDLVGKYNVERACVSDFYRIASAKTICSGHVLVVNYESEYSSKCETVYYTNYNIHVDEDNTQAKKAELARNMFGKEHAKNVVFNHELAVILTADELEEQYKISPRHAILFNKCKGTDMYVYVKDLKTLPDGNKVKTMVHTMIDDNYMYDSAYIMSKGIHQGNLSEMRNGKRSTDRMSLGNVCKYLNAFKN